MQAGNLIPAIMSWSGGKDSTLALHYLIEAQKYKVCYLLTTVNNSHHRVAIHGVRETMLRAQAESLGFPLYQVRLPELPDMVTYEQQMKEHLTLIQQQGINNIVFGDVFLEDLKKYREEQMTSIGWNTEFPLWKMDSLEVVNSFIELGYRAIIVAAKDGLENFCGRIIDHSFLNELPAGVDPCGENGEFHSFVFDGPLFKYPILYNVGEKHFRAFPTSQSDKIIEGYWYIDLIPIFS